MGILLHLTPAAAQGTASHLGHLQHCNRLHAQRLCQQVGACWARYSIMCRLPAAVLRADCAMSNVDQRTSWAACQMRL